MAPGPTRAGRHRRGDAHERIPNGPGGLEAWPPGHRRTRRSLGESAVDESAVWTRTRGWPGNAYAGHGDVARSTRRGLRWAEHPGLTSPGRWSAELRCGAWQTRAAIVVGLVPGRSWPGPVPGVVAQPPLAVCDGHSPPGRLGPATHGVVKAIGRDVARAAGTSRAASNRQRAGGTWSRHPSTCHLGVVPALPAQATRGRTRGAIRPIARRPAQPAHGVVEPPTERGSPGLVVAPSHCPSARRGD